MKPNPSFSHFTLLLALLLNYGNTYGSSLPFPKTTSAIYTHSNPIEEGQKEEQKESGEEGAIRNYNKADSLFKAKDYQGSATHTLSGLAIAEEIQNLGLLVRGYLLMVKNENGLRHERTSNTWFHKMRSVTDPNTFQAELAEGAIYLSYNFRYTNEFDSATVYAFMALSSYEFLGDSLGMIEALGQIGTIKIESEDYLEVQPLFDRAFEIAVLLNDSFALMDTYHQNGLLHQKLGAFHEAIPQYRMAYEIAIGLKEYHRAAILSGNIGSSMVTDGRPEEGLPYLEEALRLKQNNHVRGGSICHTLMDLSTLYYEMGNYDLSIEYAQEMLQLADSIGDNRFIQFAFQNLAQAENKQGDFEAAYNHIVKYTELRDVVFNAEKAKQIQELQVAYESEKKDGEIATLEQGKELERSRKQLILILGIALLVMALILLNQQRMKAKRNQTLLAKEKEIDTLKSRFFANISHEFRTPLTLILGPIQEKLEEDLSPEERQKYEMMERNAVRLKRLITDILDLTKSEEGELALDLTNVDLALVINGVTGSFASLADSKEIDFQITWHDISQLDVQIDRGKLETVLMNLLSNAFKFTPEGGKVKVDILLIPLDESEFNKQTGADLVLEITVSDTGKGIPTEQLEHVFDRFYQVEDSESRKQLGTGIGLAFSRELVLLMGGRIWAESKIGRGSRFFIAIPIVQTHREVNSSTTPNYQTTTPPPLEGLPKAGEDPHYQTPTPRQTPQQETEDEANALPILLLVEDNEDVRAYVLSIFEKEYQILVAENGEVGVDLAFEHIPDVIVSDVMMPVMDGFEMCGLLKRDMRTSHIPLLLLTAKNAPESRILGLEIEADVYMSKPFHPKELRLQVRNMLKLHQNLRDKYQNTETLIPTSDKPESMEEQFLNRLSEAMEKNYTDSEFKVEDLCAEMALSRSQLHRKLKALIGESTTRFMRTFRLKKAKALVDNHSGTISEIAYGVGFNNVSYFNKCFLEQFGTTPSESDT